MFDNEHILHFAQLSEEERMRREREQQDSLRRFYEGQVEEQQVRECVGRLAAGVWVSRCVLAAEAMCSSTRGRRRSSSWAGVVWSVG